MKLLNHIIAKLNLLTLTLALTLSISAATPWEHYIGLTLAGAEANMLPSFHKGTPEVEVYGKGSIKPLAGGAGQAALLYEARATHLFIDLGLGIDYSFTQLNAINLVESREATDITREALLYQYRYSLLVEAQRMLSAQLQAAVGFLPTENFYLLLGLRLQLPVTHNYTSTANMLTAGRYERWAADFIEDRPQFGFYPETEYKSSDSFASAKAWLTPTVELGANFDLGRTTLRAGVYADYGIRLGDKVSKPITNYSRVDIMPATQTQQNLSDNIRFTSLLDSEYLRTFSHLEVGLRLTVLFDVTTFHVPCHCVP